MKKVKLKFLPLASAVVAFAVVGILQLLKAASTYADTTISSVQLSSTITSVTEGELPAISYTNSTEGTTTNEYSTGWSYWASGDGSWHAFGTDTPTAVADGTTRYAMRFVIEISDAAYSFNQDASQYIINFNGEEYTNVGNSMVVTDSSDESTIFVYIDLGTAEVSQPIIMTTIDFHVLHNGEGGTYSVNFTTDDPDEQAKINTELSSSNNFLSVELDTPVTITATPEFGYAFMGWYAADPNVGPGESYFRDYVYTTNTTYQFIPEGGQYFAPKFVPEEDVAEITVNENGGDPILPSNVVFGIKGQTIMEALALTNIQPTHPTEDMLLVGVCFDAECDQELNGEEILDDDVTVYLKWVQGVPTDFTYNLNFYNNPEQDESTVVVYIGFPVDLEEPDPIEGYTFDGWFKNPEATEPWGWEETVTGPTTVYAHWRENLTSMSFTLEPPTIGDVVTLTYNQENDMNEPNIVPNVASDEEDKYQAVMPDWVQGLCTGGSDACMELFEGEILPNTTYYARINIHATDDYAITYETLDNITVNGSEPDEYFNINDDIDTFIIAAITTPAVQTFTLTYDTRGGTSIPSVTDEAGTIIQLPTPVKGETEFLVWEELDNEGQTVGSFNAGDDFTLDRNVELHAVWNEGGPQAGLTMTFLPGDGTGETFTIPKNNGDELTLPENVFEAPANKKFGYWMSVEGNYKPGMVTEVHNDIEFTAMWIDEDAINEFGASISAPVAGDPMVATITPVNEHYTVSVLKWYEGGTAQEPGTEITDMSAAYAENTTYILRAQFTVDEGYSYVTPLWIFINNERATWMSSTSTTADGTIAFTTGSAPVPGSYTISFDGNGGNGSMPSVNKDAGETYELPINDFEPAWNKVFDKWNVEGIGYKYPGEEITVNSNIVVTPVWRDWVLKNKYQTAKEQTQNITVRYQNDIPVLIAQKKTEFDEAMGNSPLIDSTPLFSNTEPYKYAENGHIEQGLGTLICVNGDDEIVDDAKCHAHGYDSGFLMNYYYTEVNVTKSTTVEVDFNTNGGSGTEPQEVVALGTATEPQNVTRDGYELAGWSKDEAIINENTGEVASGKSYFDFSTALDSDIILVANWKKIHTVRFDDGGILREDLKPVDQQVTAGNPIAQPKDADGYDLRDYYNDYELDGFYYDANFQTEYTNQPITSDTTLFLKWHDIYDDYTNITSVNITVTAPVAGTEITMTNVNDPTTQTPQVTVEVPANSEYDVNGAHYSNWYTSRSLDPEYFTGALIKGNKYYAAIYLAANDDQHVFARNVSVTVNGQALAAEYVNNDLDLLRVFVEVTPSLVEYEILEGENQTHSVVDNKDDGLTVRGSGELNILESVAVDGTIISEDKYEKSEGSTIVTLKPAYLNTLANGTHTLTLNWTNGSASTTFTISGQNNNPTTADTITVWNTVFVISLAMATLSVVGIKKSYRK